MDFSVSPRPNYQDFGFGYLDLTTRNDGQVLNNNFVSKITLKHSQTYVLRFAGLQLLSCSVKYQSLKYL